MFSLKTSTKQEYLDISGHERANKESSFRSSFESCVSFVAGVSKMVQIRLRRLTSSSNFHPLTIRLRVRGRRKRHL